MTQQPIRVQVASRFPSSRAGLRAMLAPAAPQIAALAETSLDASADGGLSALLPALRPDVLVIDAAGGSETDGWSALFRLAARHDCGIVLLADDAPGEAVAALNHAGVPGWAVLGRESSGSELAAAVQAAAAGLIALSPMLTAILLDGAEGIVAAEAGAEFDAALDGVLTAREREVLQLLARGLPNKQIAHRLGISLHTAKFHVAQILGRLGASTRAEAVAIGIRRGDVTS